MVSLELIMAAGSTSAGYEIATGMENKARRMYCGAKAEKGVRRCYQVRAGGGIYAIMALNWGPISMAPAPILGYAQDLRLLFHDVRGERLARENIFKIVGMDIMNSNHQSKDYDGRRRALCCLNKERFLKHEVFVPHRIILGGNGATRTRERERR